MENFNENVVENDNINEVFEDDTAIDTEINTDDEVEAGGNPAGVIVGAIVLIGGAVALVCKGGKFLYNKAKAKAKAKLIEELKAEGWVNPNEEIEDDAVEEDNESEE